MNQTTGYAAFIPTALPPDPPLVVDNTLARLLSDADRALGRLDGIAVTLPNLDLFVAMYVRQEAVLSSQIEGTQSTLEDLLIYEAREDTSEDAHTKDLGEVIRYVNAMNHGLQRLPALPLSLRLIRELHERLLAGGRGSEKNPGEFRTSQNWIGPAGCTLRTASFVPPPPHEVVPCLGALEDFIHSGHELPDLIQAALIHAQFETIHPFLDGNGRIGRLLITLFLCERKVLSRPLLYLSIYLKKYRAEYYDRLSAIRVSGDWEGWVRFFLRGIQEVSEEATATARNILQLREESRSKLDGKYAHRLLDHIFEHPIVRVQTCARALDIAFTTANSAIQEFEAKGLLVETTGFSRNRTYRFAPYLALFDNGDSAPLESQVREITSSESF